jgi:hypothetical protein
MLINPIVILSSIAITAIVSSIITYQFFDTAADKIIQLSGEESATIAKIKAHDLRNSLQNKFEVITSNLELMTHSRSIQDNEPLHAEMLFAQSQASTEDLSQRYGWVNRDGRTIWESKSEKSFTNVQSLSGDRSNEKWFVQARDNKSGYAMTLTDSLDNLPELWISSPITHWRTSDFEGVIYAAISLQKINGYLTDQLYPETDVIIDLIDTDGTILYSQYPQLVGLNYFGAEYQSLIKSMPKKVDDQKGFDIFIKQSLQEGGADSSDFTYMGHMALQPTLQ